MKKKKDLPVISSCQKLHANTVLLVGFDRKDFPEWADHVGWWQEADAAQVAVVKGKHIPHGTEAIVIRHGALQERFINWILYLSKEIVENRFCVTDDVVAVLEWLKLNFELPQKNGHKELQADKPATTTEEITTSLLPETSPALDVLAKACLVFGLPPQQLLEQPNDSHAKLAIVSVLRRLKIPFGVISQALGVPHSALQIGAIQALTLEKRDTSFRIVLGTLARVVGLKSNLDEE